MNKDVILLKQCDECTCLAPKLFAFREKMVCGECYYLVFGHAPANQRWEQCVACYDWFPFEDMTWDEQENTVCRRCSPIIYKF